MHSFLACRLFLRSSFAYLSLPLFPLLHTQFTYYLFRGKVVVSEIKQEVKHCFLASSPHLFFGLISHPSSYPLAAV